MYIYIYLRCDRSESEPIQTNKFPPSTTAWTLSFLRFTARSPISRLCSAATFTLSSAAFFKASRTAALFSCGQQVFYNLYSFMLRGFKSSPKPL